MIAPLSAAPALPAPLPAAAPPAATPLAAPAAPMVPAPAEPAPDPRVSVSWGFEVGRSRNGTFEREIHPIAREHGVEAHYTKSGGWLSTTFDGSYTGPRSHAWAATRALEDWARHLARQ